MNIVLVIGCFGREEEKFISCNSVKNEILDLSKNTERNSQIADYLDKVYRLFDKPLYNNIHTAIFNIQEKFSEKGKPVFKEKFFKMMEEFCKTHNKCGTYLKLEMKEE